MPKCIFADTADQKAKASQLRDCDEVEDSKEVGEQHDVEDFKDAPDWEEPAAFGAEVAAPLSCCPSPGLGSAAAASTATTVASTSTAAQTKESWESIQAEVDRKRSIGWKVTLTLALAYPISVLFSM